jgi:hypothetical protein
VGKKELHDYYMRFAHPDRLEWQWEPIEDYWDVIASLMDHIEIRGAERIGLDLTTEAKRY